jgi:phytoene dehydrogenase-like protein
MSSKSSKVGLALLHLVPMGGSSAFAFAFAPPSSISSTINNRNVAHTIPSSASSSSFRLPSSSSSRRRSVVNAVGDIVITNAQQANNDGEEVVDCIIIGSGIGGLSCAALLAATGRTVKVLEKHYELGGCAHEFYMDMNGKVVPSSTFRNTNVDSQQQRRDLFHFEAGPSLYSDLSSPTSSNPLKHIYQMIDEEPEWITYDQWGAFLPEAPEGYQMSIGAENFEKILETYGGGKEAVEDWTRLAEVLRPMSKGVKGIPHVAVRPDAGILLTVAMKYPMAFINILRNAPLFTESFNLDELGLKNEFLRNYLDMLAFLLQGLPADQTLKVVMAFMIEDFFKENAVMDFPKGGSGELIAALARGVTKRNGCSIDKSTTVEEVLVENGRAVGVKLAKSGRIIRAKEAVISNADLTNTFNFVPIGVHARFDEERVKFMGQTNNPNDSSDSSVPYCKSFMHLHLGVKVELIPEDAPPQWTVVRDWSKGIDAIGNVVVVSVGSKLDNSLAPPGYHVIHAYTAGNEPYEDWAQFEHLLEDASARDKDEAYQTFKNVRAQPIWDAIQKRAPLVVKEDCTVVKVGTPLTHGRFLSRHRGNYGLAIAPGNEEGWKFPDVITPIEGYYRCGDSTTSGIGVPAVASSGAICANSIMSVWEQLALNSKIKMP